MKRIFVTGASSGIGLAISHAFTQRGDEVWGTSRNIARLPQCLNFHALPMDLRDRNSIQNAFATAWREAGHLDLVINNAGSGYFGATESSSLENLADEFQLLVFAHIEILQLALAAMRPINRGLIINITSLASRLPVPFMAGYNAAKAAMASFTMSLQLELASSKIRLVDLQPADIRTSFNEAVRKIDNADARVAKTWAAVEKNLNNAPPPELVARHVLRLADSKNPAPRVTVGDFFQSKIAPFLLRFLPQRVQLWGLRKYYGI